MNLDIFEQKTLSELNKDIVETRKLTTSQNTCEEYDICQSCHTYNTERLKHFEQRLSNMKQRLKQDIETIDSIRKEVLDIIHTQEKKRDTISIITACKWHNKIWDDYSSDNREEVKE